MALSMVQLHNNWQHQQKLVANWSIMSCMCLSYFPSHIILLKILERAWAQRKVASSSNSDRELTNYLSCRAAAEHPQPLTLTM